MKASLALSALLLTVPMLAACGGSSGGSSGAPATTPPTSSTAPVASSGANPSAGGAAAKGYDCPTLLTPAELDAASGLTGGTVKTTSRGDQPGAGEVPGVTQCAVDNPTVSVWTGAFAVYTGDEALANYETVWGIAKSGGATSLAGVGTEALLLVSSDKSVHGYARGSNGVGLEIGIAWDDQTTTEEAVKDAVKQILATVLPRT